MEACTSRDDIAWRQSGDWMNVPNYVASQRICSVPCNLLTALLRAMKISGYSKLTHRLKAELLLKHLGWTADAIEAALVNLKVRTRKKREDGQVDDQQQEQEDCVILCLKTFQYDQHSRLEYVESFTLIKFINHSFGGQKCLC